MVDKVGKMVQVWYNQDISNDRKCLSSASAWAKHVAQGHRHSYVQ